MTGKLRIHYGKTGRAKYISHLDLMAIMRRAFLRAGFSLKYSEGFNPHPYISVALPLQVGCESLCELMDIGIEGSPDTANLPSMINPVLPEGLTLFDAYTTERKFSDITWLELKGKLFYDNGTAQYAADSLEERFAGKSIIVQKKTKRGTSGIDIAPHIRDFRLERGGALSISAKVSAQNPSVGPSMLISAMDIDGSAPAPDFAVFTRIEVFDADMRVFR